MKTRAATNSWDCAIRSSGRRTTQHTLLELMVFWMERLWRLIATIASDTFMRPSCARTHATTTTLVDITNDWQFPSTKSLCSQIQTLRYIVSTDLNGKSGVVVDFNNEIARYVVIAEGSAKTVNVKPQNVLPAYMGCEKEKMVALAKELSNQDE